jgi:hypothetical protein
MLRREAAWFPKPESSYCSEPLRDKWRFRSPARSKQITQSVDRIIRQDLPGVTGLAGCLRQPKQQCSKKKQQMLLIHRLVLVRVSPAVFPKRPQSYLGSSNKFSFPAAHSKVPLCPARYNTVSNHPEPVPGSHGMLRTRRTQQKARRGDTGPTRQRHIQI